MLFRKKKKQKKQDALFSEALQEAGYEIDPGLIRTDHPTARCYYGKEEFPLVFPLRFLREARALDFQKRYDFSFRGLQTPRRDWVRAYESPRSAILFTDTGRKIEKKTFDRDYYQELAHSRFTLCPSGDFIWTYRFFEAMMCLSIPVVEAGVQFDQFEGYIYFHSDSDQGDLLRAWSMEAAMANYQLFLKRNTLLQRFIFIN